LPATIRHRLAAAAHADTIVHIITADEVGTPVLLPPGTGPSRTWHFTATNVRDFAWGAAANFIWDATSWDGILMQAFYPPTVADVWKTAADMNRHAVMIHSRWFHYPWPTAISVEGPVGGMEYPMITFDNAQNEKELYYTIAHEHGHEWFPMIVGSDERLYPWMDEGFNTFIDWFSFRSRYPDDTTRIQALEFGSMRAYQQFLRTYRGVETPIMESQDRSPNGLMSGWNAYGKPAVALHFLREQVVDSGAFDDAFREYVRRWALRHPQPADFFRTMNSALGEDLSWFWRSWFVRSDHLDQAVDSVVQRDTAGQTLTRVFLSNRLEMVAPVELRVTGGDSASRTVKLPVEAWLRGQRTVWAHVTPPAAKPVRIEIDPRGVYPDVDRSNNTWIAVVGNP
jgi:aminopeptidase N